MRNLLGRAGCGPHGRRQQQTLRAIYSRVLQANTPNDGWDELATSRLKYAGFETRISPADRQD